MFRFWVLGYQMVTQLLNLCLFVYFIKQVMTGSAAKFGNWSPFGLLFEQLATKFWALATWHFGYFLGYFLK